MSTLRQEDSLADDYLSPSQRIEREFMESQFRVEIHVFIASNAKNMSVGGIRRDFGNPYVELCHKLYSRLVSSEDVLSRRYDKIVDLDLEGYADQHFGRVQQMSAR